MACNCKFPKLYRATSVAVATGATTITISATPELNAGDVIDIGLFTAIPDGTDGTTLSVTNGTVTAFVMAPNGNYFRPLPLTSRTILRVQYLGDPSHFQILGIKKGR
jgi:hypothetical protein